MLGNGCIHTIAAESCLAHQQAALVQFAIVERTVFLRIELSTLGCGKAIKHFILLLKRADKFSRKVSFSLNKIK
jgi:hypothetical protein